MGRGRALTVWRLSVKVIHLISGGDTGGAKTHVHSLLYNLNKTIDATLVCFTKGEFSDEAIALGIPTVIFEGRNFLGTFTKLCKFIKDGEYELIHCHGSRGNLTGALLKRFTDLPVISTVHSDYRLDYLGRPIAHLTYGNVNALCLRFMDYRIGVSGSMKKLLVERGFKPNGIFTIYNGMDFSRPPKTVTNEQRRAYFKRVGLNADEHCVVVGIAARLDPVKDVETLIRGFALAHKQTPDLRLLIAGDGLETARLTLLVEELGISGAACLAGWLDDMDEFYACIDINTLTSISETFPYALTEGAVYRLPTISSRVGGVPELISHGETGFLFEPKDYEALSRHLQTLANDAALRKQLGDKLHKKASDEFSMDASRRRQLEIYDLVLEREKLKRGDRQGVLICGAYGHGNSGDDAILEAIVRQMQDIDPKMPVSVLSRRPKETMQRYGIDAVYTFNLLSFMRLMKKTKLYINGGGSLIQDVTSRRSLWYYLFTIRTAKSLGNKVIMYGCGIGPVDYVSDQKLVKRILNKYVDIISLREDHSLEELKAFNVTNPEIVLSSDPALSLPPANAEVVSEKMRELGLDPDGKYVCFTLRRWRGFSSRAVYFAKAATHMYKKYGLIPVFLSINHRNDGDAAERVSSMLRDVPYHILRTPMDSSLTIGFMAKMQLNVSMRLHGLVFAASQGVPLVGVAYDPKVTAFLNYIGQDLHIPFDDVTAEILIGLVDKAVMRSGSGDWTNKQIARLQEIEQRNVDAAKKLLGL